MTNQELAAKRTALRGKTNTLANVSPMLAMGEFKAAALLMAEITDEIARRELLVPVEDHAHG